MYTQILYNGIDPFSGICGTPLVQLNEQFIEYGERWGAKNTITLTSTITGGCNYFNQLISGQNSIIQTFSQDFQSLQIIESGIPIFNKPYCIIRGVNFPDSPYLKLLPFSIEIDCYESGFFSGVYGVLEPKNEFTIVQEKDQSIRFEHSLSCRGFNTSSTNSNALQNAQNFIAQYSGFNNQVTPYFIQFCSGINPSLIASDENINRVNGTYAVTETYIAEPNYNSGILRYTATYNSGINDGISTVDINGTIRTAKNFPLSVLRGRYSGFSILSAAIECYSGATNSINLNPLYLTSGISEDPAALTLSFQTKFNDDVTPSPYFDYRVDFATDNITSITSAKIEGVVKARGELSQKWLAVQAYSTGINLFGIVANEYISDGYQYILNPAFITQNITKNPYSAEISLGASYNDKLVPPSGLVVLDYSLSFTPSIERISAIPVLNGTGQWYITDLGYTNRSLIKLDGNATVDPAIPLQSGVKVLTNYINYLNSIYCTGARVVLEDMVLGQGNRNIGLDTNFSTLTSMENTRYNP